MRSPGLARGAALLLGLEALALAGIAVSEFIKLSEAASQLTGIALGVLTLLAAATLALCAVGVWQGRSWARSGGVVLHVLALVVALAALTTDPPAPTAATIVGVPALVGLVLLISSARAEAERPPAPSEDAPEN